MRRRGLATSVVVAVAIAVMAGCTAPSLSASNPAPAEAPSSLSAVSVTAELYRTRSDPARNGIQLSVTNHGDVPLTVLRAVLETPALDTALKRDRTTVIPPGATRDLALVLVAPRCTGGPGAPEAELTIALSTGESAVIRVTTTDRLGQWADWHERSCFAQAAAERVELELRRAPALDDFASQVIGVEIVAMAPTGGVTLVSLSDSVLFALLDGEGSTQRVSTISLGRELAAGDVTVIPVRLAAARCDPHAVAEDKQGTIFVVDLSLDGERGSATIIADDATRAELYDAIAESCRF